MAKSKPYIRVAGDWLQEHIGHISASEVSAIFGKGFYGPIDLARRKKEEIATGKIEDKQVALWDMGHALEPVIAKYFLLATQANGIALTMDKGFDKDVLFRSKSNPLFQVTPDRLLNKRTSLAELKYDSGGSYYYKSPNDFKINEGYLFQVQYQLMVMGMEKGYLTSMNNRGDLWYMEVYASDKIKSLFEERVPEFWEQSVVGDKEPDCLTVEDTKICKILNEPIVAVEEIKDAITRLNEMELQMKVLKNNIGYDDKENGFEALKDKVKVFMGHNDQLLDEDGNELATYKGDKRRMFKLK